MVLACQSGTASATRQATFSTAAQGDIACDHYRRWQDDIVWMRRLGLNAYRFLLALEYPRILPHESGHLLGNGV